MNENNSTEDDGSEETDGGLNGGMEDIEYLSSSDVRKYFINDSIILVIVQV